MELTKTQLDAVELLFDDQLTHIAIAEQLGIDVRTLQRWQEIPAFAQELSDLHEHHRNWNRKRAVYAKAKLFGAILDRYSALNRLITERAKGADPDVPGDCTGLLLKKVINTKKGVIIEARVDHATLRELSRLESEIGRMLGEDKPLVVIDDKEMSKALRDTAVDESVQPTTGPILNRAARRRAQKRGNNKIATTQIPGQNRTLVYT